MRLVDTATLAYYLGVSARTIRYRAKTGALTPAGHRHTGKRGRPTLLFDLDDPSGKLDKTADIADIDR